MSHGVRIYDCWVPVSYLDCRISFVGGELAVNIIFFIKQGANREFKNTQYRVQSSIKLGSSFEATLYSLRWGVVTGSLLIVQSFPTDLEPYVCRLRQTRLYYPSDAKATPGPARNCFFFLLFFSYFIFYSTKEKRILNLRHDKKMKKKKKAWLLRKVPHHTHFMYTDIHRTQICGRVLYNGICLVISRNEILAIRFHCDAREHEDQLLNIYTYTYMYI